VSQRSGMALALALTIAAGACVGKPVDPLAADRARLLELDQTTVERDWPAQATVLLSERMLNARAQEAAANALAANESERRLSLLGMELVLRPNLAVERIRLAPSKACAACAALSADIIGVVDVALGGGGAALTKRVALSATATGTLEIVVTPLDGGRRLVQARAVPAGDWAVELSLEGLSADWNAGISELLEDQLRQAVALQSLPDFDLVELPVEGPVRVRDLRIRVAERGLAIDFAFQVLDAGVAEDPAALDGWVAAVPAATVLGIARAAALREPPVDGHAPEPIRLDLDGDRFTLTVRLWTIAPKPTSRDFEVSGRFAVGTNGALALDVDNAREVGAGGRDLNPMTMITRAHILQRLTESLGAVVPSSYRHRLVGQEIELRLVEPVARAEVLYLYGSSRVLPATAPASSPAE